MPPRPSPTHFLCIPLVTGASRHQLSASIGSFKADVASPDSFGIPEQAVRPVGTIHLTLGVMSFPKNENNLLEQAVSLLKMLVPRQILAGVNHNNNNNNNNNSATAPADVASDPAAPPPPKETAELSAGPPLSLSVTLRGLHSMQSASKATVLYTAPVDPDGTLLRFCEHLRSAFQKAGLMVEEGRPLLLHATIMNTVYVKGRDRGGGGGGAGGQRDRGGKRKNERLTIDARAILDRYDDFVWMEHVPVEKIAICRMGAKKLDDDGDEAYEVEAEIDFA